MGKGGEMNTGKGDESGGYENPNYPVIIGEDGIPLMEGDNVTYRATYLIDEEGIVFHEGINHMPIGRNVQEYLRLIDACIHVQEKGEVCPANWETGKDAMTEDRKGVISYLSSH